MKNYNTKLYPNLANRIFCRILWLLEVNKKGQRGRYVKVVQAGREQMGSV